MNSNHISSKLLEILKKRSGLDFEAAPELQSVKLLGAQVRMPARELLHVYFGVTEAFGIEIPEEDVVAGRFDTFENIRAIVEKQLSA